MNGHTPPAAELLAENVKLQQELLRAHALLRRFASGNYNFARLRDLCEQAEELLSGAGERVYGAGNSYADLDERVGVNRPALHREPSAECPGCRDMGWSGSGER